MISRRACGAGVLALTFAASIRLVAAADDVPPEPYGYRIGNYRAPVPRTLSGAQVLSTLQAHVVWQAGSIFVDVLPQPPRPEGLPPGTIWHPKPRFDIPGSIWLPDTGYGVLAPVMETYFQNSLTAATGGDPARPMVFYCLHHCWMSWNAAKRALSLGYSKVDWYPDGTNGWSAAGFPLEHKQPVPRPSLSDRGNRSS